MSYGSLQPPETALTLYWKNGRLAWPYKLLSNIKGAPSKFHLGEGVENRGPFATMRSSGWRREIWSLSTENPWRWRGFVCGTIS